MTKQSERPSGEARGVRIPAELWAYAERRAIQTGDGSVSRLVGRLLAEDRQRAKEAA